jgi:uncharacterized membrane protein
VPEVAYKALVTVLAVDVLIALISIPLILRKVPRNWVYGVRTPATLKSDEIWYPANEYGGKALLVSSVISAIGVLILVNVDGIPPKSILNFSIACMAGPPLVAVVFILRYVGKLVRGEDGPRH